jgi:Cysteine-rich CWC
MSKSTEQPGEKCCPECGARFTCEYELGRPCWCGKAYPPAMPLTQTTRGCYCPRCLEQKIAQRKAKLEESRR